MNEDRSYSSRHQIKHLPTNLPDSGSEDELENSRNKARGTLWNIVVTNR